MKKIKHFSLTLAFLISFTSYSFSQEYEQKSLFLKVKEHISIELTKKNDKAWNLFLNKNGILNISKAFRSVEMNQYYYIETKPNIDLAKLILEFKQFEFIEFAERVPIYNLFFTPNDPQYSNQWNLVKVQADQAWNINQGSTAIKIAVVDDGFLLNHEDLASQWHINTNEIPNNNIDDDNNGYIDDWRGWDAANNDNTPSAFNPTNSNFTHGTHVAGIVAGATNNSMGIASIGFNCKMIPVKIADDASSSLSGAYLGVEYAIMSGANIMNMSWGGSGYSATYQALFNLAKSKGMVCVAAAGNASTSMPMYPASYNNVISVASSTITDALSSFTNYGATIDVTAPGSNILSSLAGSTSSYGNFDGTSMASPLVAGICGLMMSNNLGMHPDSVEACLKRSCDNIDSQNPNFIGQFGAGRVNAFKALQCTQKAPLADFEVLDTFQCVNTIVRYKSNSSGIQPLTYSWSFPGGTPSTSTLANPQVTYSSPGLYSATLTVTNNFGTNTITKTNIVRIGTPTAKLSGRKYTTFGTNAAILAINFIGTPPYNITLTDGSNVWTQNNITSNPYFYSITPIKDTSIIQIQSLSDKNCVGIGSVNDTIVKLNASAKTMCRDSIVLYTNTNDWFYQNNLGVWVNATLGINNCNQINHPLSPINLINLQNGNQMIWGSIQNNSCILKREVFFQNISIIDSVRVFIQGDDNIVSFRLNGTLISSTPFGWSNTSSVKINNSLLNSGSNIFTIEGTNNGSCGWVAARIVIYTDSCKNSENQTCDTSGLILCMAMDGNANDSSKYNNHGIIRGATPTIGRDGKTNSAYYFNGTTNHINLGVKNILKPSAASISVWVKPQTFNSYIGTNSNTIIITKNPNNPSSFMEGYSLSLTNRTGSTKYMAINTHQPTNNEKWFMSNQNTNINQWTHLVLTFDFDSIKLYVNGQLDNKIYKGFNNVYDAFDSVVIGYSANIMNKNYFKGDIDELKMYNRVLSSSEILNLYTKPFTCSCASSSSSNQTDCDTSGLVLCMAMDGNAKDSTKYKNDGVIIGGVTSVPDKSGNINSALSFNGTNGYIEVPNNTSLQLTNELTISLWINQLNVAQGYRLVDKITAATGDGYLFDTYGHPTNTTYRGRTTRFVGKDITWHSNNKPYNLNSWIHVAVTHKDGLVTYYTNGILDTSYSHSLTSLNINTLPLRIGAGNPLNFYFNGAMDNLKIYRKALTSSEILNLYTKPFTCSCLASSSSNQTDCDTTNLNVGKVLHLDFNGNTQDKSGNNNHATNFGATLVAGKDGLANTAYRFNGSSKMVVNNFPISNTNELTISIWYKSNNNFQTNYAGLIDHSHTIGTLKNWVIQHMGNSNSIYFGWRQNTSSWFDGPQINYSPNTWNHLIVVKSIDTIKYYLNCNSVASASSIPNTIYKFIANLNIGYVDNTNRYFEGDIDDIKIYHRALKENEINALCGQCNISSPISVKCDTGKKYVYTKCFNDTIQLNVGKGKNHQWSPTTDLSNGNIQNPKCFAKSSIQYFVLYNDTNNCQIIDTFQINVFPSNHIPLFDSTVCIGDSIFYSLDNNGTNYNWNPNQYLSSNNQSSVWIKPLTNTSYNISYKDINGCIILDTFDIKTKACCDLKAQFEISDSIICKSGLVSIFNKSKNITNGIYSWEFKNLTPTQFTGYSPASISLNSPGTYSIKLKTSNGICEDSMIRNIYVIDIKANAGKDSTFCTGRISNFKIGDTNTISDYKYSWNPTLGLNNADISSPTVNISQNQQYELSVYDPFTGCIALDTIILTINSNLDTFNYVDTLCDGDTKVFFGQNIMIDGTYQHYVKDNQNCDKEVHILKVFFRKISYTNSIQKACNFYIDKMGIKHTDSFEYNDTTYTKGCITNIHTTKIKILKTRYEETEMIACYKINWKGNTYFDTIKKIDSFVFKDNGCDTLIQYVNLNVVKKSDIKIISTHANPLNYGEEIILQAFGSNNYKWNTGERGFQISHKAKENNVFYVVGYNNILCPDTAYYNIYIDNNSVIELPDIFSPNDDGKNDIFRPNYKGNVQILDLIIFNRWGEKIYEGHGNETFWDGKFKGEYQSSGVYIYLFKYIFNGKEVSKKGSFVLVR